MISHIASTYGQAANIAALRQNRVQKTESAQDATVETVSKQKAAHPAHPHGHIPPGLARAAEKIASKIFARADADDNGLVTRQELSAVHSRHARTLASSDLFQTTTTQTPSEAATATTDTPTDTTTESTTETPTQVGITEAQLKEALTKFFYAKVGATYTPPTTEQPAPSASTNTTTPPVIDSISNGTASNPTFTAVA
jgi:hypothetical protein